jgi:hypothetical protein
LRSEDFTLRTEVLHLRSKDFTLRTEVLHLRSKDFAVRAEVLHVRSLSLASWEVDFRERSEGSGLRVDNDSNRAEQGEIEAT